MRHLSSFQNRLTLSHILAVTLCAVVGTWILTGIDRIFQTPLGENHRIINSVAVDWYTGQPNEVSNDERFADLPFAVLGFGLIVAPDDEVLFTQGNTPCNVGDQLSDCAGELSEMPIGDRFYEDEGASWWEKVAILSDGNRLISRHTISTEMDIGLGRFGVVRGVVPVTLGFSLLAALVSLPFALFFAIPIVRLQARRLMKLMQTSRTLARGELHVRTGDHHQDMIGKLAQAFDSMADSVAQHIGSLRALAQHNQELAQQTKNLAAQTERTRITRNLHNLISDNLFTLAAGVASLPDIIDANQARSIEQAHVIAELAEDALIHMRHVLVDLRPNDASHPVESPSSAENGGGDESH